jgi:hypothetical protein
MKMGEHQGVRLRDFSMGFLKEPPHLASFSGFFTLIKTARV